MKKATYYFDSQCSTCTSARELIDSLDRNCYDIEYVDFTADRSRLDEAESAGVKTIPALVSEGHVFHINYDGPLSSLREAPGKREQEEYLEPEPETAEYVEAGCCD